MGNHNKTALVTGANAGLGFEAAAQLAENGWGKVILACRSLAKAERARAELKERTGEDPFTTLVIDTSEVDSAKAAAAELDKRGEQLDFLLLNAGASKKDATFNSAGHEITYASTLIGHHVLTLGAVERNLLAPHARIVIAGSEGSRNTMPGMKLHDIGALADRHEDGDWAQTISRLVKLELPEQQSFVNMNEYVTAKLIVAWWTAALAKKLPAGVTVNCVSPGAAMGTSFARDAPAAMRVLMIPVMKVLGPLMGMNGSVADGAKRYVDAAARGNDDTGNFYATAHPKKLVGPVGLQESYPQFFETKGFDAAFEALVTLTGIDYPAGAQSAQRATA